MSLEVAGIKNPGRVYLNPSPAELVEHAIRRGEAQLSDTGALVAETGKLTGRSPKDRFFVRHGKSAGKIDWGARNQPFELEKFDALYDRVREHLEGKELFVIDGYIGADPQYRIKLRVVAEYAWHALFAQQLFRRPPRKELEDFEPEFVSLSSPTFVAVPERDGTRTETFVGIDLERELVLIVGSGYAGEIKKSIFTSGNYLFPEEGAAGMHCSANVDEDDKVALFFGLSGTGKTTLSADPSRRLIGDDEHGWSDNGVFNFEGGCYAKCINLSKEKEPQIFDAIRFGSVIENVIIDPVTREPDFKDDSLTENTRVAYPLEFIANFVPEGRAGHASTVVFLTADAFGVLPPISRLSPAATMYHFLSGFTSKLAGTEAGLGDEPEPSFSTCFGAPFLPLNPSVYAQMLRDRIEKHGASVYLVNTGWTGGPFGVGERMDLAHTRAIVNAATSGALDEVETRRHPIFNVDVPVACPGVPGEVLDARGTWSNPAEYDAQARELARMFAKNFEQYRSSVPTSVAEAGPSAD
ncbi:MAG: phosphoenolpyruvate carboxykinase (ATP) [Actinobacteria bacterium]|nr:phosphoenolpyruvate carboxykinase (ATP) [Actinomycetota bacterium]